MKRKNVKCHYFTGDTLQGYVRCTSVTLRASPFGIICSTSHFVLCPGFKVKDRTSVRIENWRKKTSTYARPRFGQNPPAPVLLSRRRIQSPLYSYYFTTGGKPSTWFPPGGLVEQNFGARNFKKN